MKKTMIALAALGFTLALAAPALAENPAAASAQAQKEEVKNLRKEIVRLKYVRADQISAILRSYTSPWGQIHFQNSLPFVLSVSDSPENVEKVLAVIRELDVKPADVLFTVQLVLGTAGETDQGAKQVADSDPLIKELRSLLKYKTYSLLDATFLRVVNMDRASAVLGPKAEFELALRPEVAGDAKAPLIKTEVRLRQIVRVLAKPPAKAEGGEPTQGAVTNVNTLIETSLNVKSGDRTVVGVSKLDGGDKGLILIISAKIVD
jgi:hypothetical protein